MVAANRFAGRRTGRLARVEVVGSIPRVIEIDPDARTSRRRSERWDRNTPSLPGLGSSKSRGAVPDYSSASAAFSGDLAQSRPLRGPLRAPRHGRLASAESMYKDLILTFAPKLSPKQDRRCSGADNEAVSEDPSGYGHGVTEVESDDDESVNDEAEVASVWEAVSRRAVDFFGEQMDRSLKTPEDVRTAEAIMDELEEWKCMPNSIGIAAKTHLDAITANNRQLAQRGSDGISPRTL